jgi:hypothetical protein
MAIGCALVVIATFIQTFAPQGNIGAFIAGRAIVGAGQGIALSKYLEHLPFLRSNISL